MASSWPRSILAQRGANPGLMSARSKIILLQGKLANLRVQRHLVLRCRHATFSKDVRRALQQPPFPITDLLGMHFKPRLRLRQRAVSRSAKATRALNAGLWVRRIRRPDVFFIIRNSFLPDHFQLSLFPEFPLIALCEFAGPLPHKNTRFKDRLRLLNSQYTCAFHPRIDQPYYRAYTPLNLSMQPL